MTDKSRNLRLRNPLTFESRKLHAEKLFREGWSAKYVQSQLKTQFGVGLGDVDMAYAAAVAKVTPGIPRQVGKQLILPLVTPDADAVLEQIPYPAACAVVKHMLEKGFHCFVLPDGALEIKR